MASHRTHPSHSSSSLRQALLSDLSQIIAHLNNARSVSLEAQNVLSNQSSICKLKYMLFCKQEERWKRLERSMDNRLVPLRNRSRVKLAMEKLDRALAVEAYWRREEINLRVILNEAVNTRNKVQMYETGMLERIESLRINVMTQQTSTGLNGQFFSPDETVRVHNSIEVLEKKEQSSASGIAFPSSSNGQTNPIRFAKLKLAAMFCLSCSGRRK